MQAREYCGSVGIKHKPIILSHHMLFLDGITWKIMEALNIFEHLWFICPRMGLKAGQAKMSKSDPDSAVFMEDSLNFMKSR